MLNHTSSILDQFKPGTFKCTKYGWEFKKKCKIKICGALFRRLKFSSFTEHIFSNIFHFRFTNEGQRQNPEVPGEGPNINIDDIIDR